MREGGVREGCVREGCGSMVSLANLIFTWYQFDQLFHHSFTGLNNKTQWSLVVISGY